MDLGPRAEPPSPYLNHVYAGTSEPLREWEVDSPLTRSAEKVDQRLRELVRRLLGLVVAGVDRSAA